MLPLDRGFSELKNTSCTLNSTEAMACLTTTELWRVSSKNTSTSPFTLQESFSSFSLRSRLSRLNRLWLNPQELHSPHRTESKYFLLTYPDSQNVYADKPPHSFLLCWCRAQPCWRQEGGREEGAQLRAEPRWRSTGCRLGPEPRSDGTSFPRVQGVAGGGELTGTPLC